jgi:hypothetical protein
VVGPDGDRLHVAGTQGPPTVQQAPLHQRRVSHHLVARSCHRVQAAQRVLPVRLGHVVEDVVEQRSARLPGGVVEVAGVADQHRDVPRHRPARFEGAASRRHATSARYAAQSVRILSSKTALGEWLSAATAGSSEAHALTDMYAPGTRSST